MGQRGNEPGTQHHFIQELLNHVPDSSLSAETLTVDTANKKPILLRENR